jgi:hypothetical protein
MKLDTEEIDTALREAIVIAEDEYNSPAIVILAHPSVKKLLCREMGMSGMLRNVRIDGYRIFESTKASLHVLVCAEGHEHRYDIYGRRLKSL